MSALAMTGTMFTTLLRRFINSMSRGLRLQQSGAGERLAEGHGAMGTERERRGCLPLAGWS